MKKWLVKTAMKKAIRRMVVALVAYLSATNLDAIGVHVDWAVFEPAVTVILIGAGEAFLNWLKVHHNVKWL